VSEIIYNGAIGPYESHETVDQIYLVRYGTAKAIYDGRLVNPTVVGPGQIRGTGVIDGSEYTIASGDIVFIPRNQVHFVDPGIGKIGYLLVSVPSSQSGFTPPPPTSGGRGRGTQ
jgi:mannose-6-phosphate isomerase-like protein (cupin superfamily)